MRYIAARAEAAAKEEAYRIYVTQSLKLIAENTAKQVGGGYIKASYADLIHPKPEETRTADEIIAHMKEKLASMEAGQETEALIAPAGRAQ